MFTRFLRKSKSFSPSFIPIHSEKRMTSFPNESVIVNGNGEKQGGLLVLLRHGQSMWNCIPQHPDRMWRYAGAYDVALSKKGVEEAVEAGRRLRDIPVDVVFSSCLSRATMTAMLALNDHSSGKTPVCSSISGSYIEGLKGISQLPTGTALPIISSSKLNERNFGDLQGIPSTEHLKRHTKEFLHKVRNDFHTRFPGETGESSFDVYDRVIPYFESEILPRLLEGKNVLLVSHGFVMRCLIKYLDGMDEIEWNYQMSIEKSNPEECKLLASTGVPLVYQYEQRNKEDLKSDTADAIPIPRKIGCDRAYLLEQSCATY
uniref:phosphoglycerate mutase (2,3-diphosphoglycerate-dependent) n=1 Tax=Aplanochytrium stocchinoi TaxID=215587 RepID=A0A7S3LJV6_9STRA|mmetsp:Transcript_32761/g.40240  ORF Transcript_32761/g.40240 Transcript_32761/m.40240 type:complete len:317 (+) Transcript_32761:149-1099(+)